MSSGCCGCPRKQWAKCAHPWHFGFHHGGREWRVSLDVVASARGAQPPRSTNAAKTWADRLRSEIRAGTFIDPASPAPIDTRLTFGDVCDAYLKARGGKPGRRASAQRLLDWHVGILRRTEVPAAKGATVRLAAKPIDMITKADVEAVREARRVNMTQAREASAQAAGAATDEDRKRLRALARHRPGVKGGEVGINRLLARLRHVFSWAIAEGHVADTPFKRGPVTVVRANRDAETARTRRLQPGRPGKPGEEPESGEEERLLQHAGPHLRALIVAALSTGCRLGELLSLQWHQVQHDERGEPRWLVLSAEKTKTHTARVVPVGPRLRSELAMRRHDPEGNDLPAHAYIFGNDVGEPVASIKTAWRTVCSRAGITDLHFHDLRREFACRLLESRADLHDVRDFLGHANITTTSRYLQSAPVRLERALARMESVVRTPFAHEADSADTPAASEPDKSLN